MVKYDKKPVSKLVKTENVSKWIDKKILEAYDIDR